MRNLEGVEPPPSLESFSSSISKGTKVVKSSEPSRSSMGHQMKRTPYGAYLQGKNEVYLITAESLERSQALPKISGIKSSSKKNSTQLGTYIRPTFDISKHYEESKDDTELDPPASRKFKNLDLFALGIQVQDDQNEIQHESSAQKLRSLQESQFQHLNSSQPEPGSLCDEPILIKNLNFNEESKSQR